MSDLTGYQRWAWERTNPDCRGGKHVACAGDAWDTEDDKRIDCMCGCHDKGANE